ncbi:MAG: dihydrolipoyllysine-residue (2-methylpropanoyl)transferase [Gammaproteobacteria bacterium]|nr:MAG: dihydrolipoyllysine-residue (2-methylpropanoyl)transferase [Gammaproteobacteria bacterium]
MKTFKLPDLGEGLPDAEIVRWLVKEGDVVRQDQPMVEMETAKAVVEVPAPFSGTIVKFHGQPGDVIQTGAPLVDIDDGEADSASSTGAPQEESGATEVPPAPSNANQATGHDEIFHLPDLGEGLPEAEIVRWLVKEGDTVKVDQPMAEMETAKAVVEVPAPMAGTIKKLHGQPGDIIKTGAPLITFGVVTPSQATTQEASVSQPKANKQDAGTVVGAVQVGNTIAQETEFTVNGKKVTPVVRALAKKMGVDLAQVEGTGAGGTITLADVKKAAESGQAKASTPQQQPTVSHSEPAIRDENPLAFRASPAVRALAKRLGVRLSDCVPSGKKGTITRADVEKAAQQGARPAAPPSDQPKQATSGLPTINVSVAPEPVRGARRAMANAMTLSHQNVVPVTLMDDADISAWRKGTDATARLLRAIAKAALAEPALNAWFDGEKMERLLHPSVNIGVAVDTPDGLYVPVMKDCQRLSLSELRQALDTLIARVRDKTISPQEMQGATISLSNFGTIAGRYGTPIVVPPQVAILGAGRYREELKLTERGIVKSRILPLSLSFDHRACTGGEGARFLAAVIEDLQKPE